MIPLQRQSSSSSQPNNYNNHPPQPQSQPPRTQQDSHPAMIISHQPFEQGFYPASQARIANPNSFHRQTSLNTIDPSLLAMNHFGGTPPVKQEDQIDPLGADPFLNIGEGYELGGGLEIGDPNVILSPSSGSPLDEAEFGQRNFTPHGSGSLSTSMHSTPYGTPGMQMPHQNFYSMSMPVHATNGFGLMDQSKMMGSQPSSYSAYGQIPEMIDDGMRNNIDAITEKRRRRRESHNAVERRRRDNINEKIQELATLLPDFASDSQNKPNKGVILRRSVDYIRQMQGFAKMQVDRVRELEGVLRRVCEEYGVREEGLGLSVPIGTVVEMPSVAPPGPGEQHVDHHEREEYGMDM